MAKLYPPTISGIIPAFYGGTIMVPFSMNKAVSRSEVGGFSLKVKNISNDTKEVLSTDDTTGIEDGIVYFDFNTYTPVVGQYYKVQLAYKSTNGEIGHYSTVGVVKCTQKPSLIIDGLNAATTNAHIYDYTAIFSTKGNQDTTEKLYTYRWILRDANNVIIQDSGIQMHNVSKDDAPNEATEEYRISQDFEIGAIYTLQFLATTTNGLTLATPRYKLQQKRSVASEIDVDLRASLNYDNGIIILDFSRSATDTISGTFLLSRANQNAKYAWEELKRFDLHNALATEWVFTDYTIEQGQNYIYSLQQYNENNIYSERILSNVIYADFEDAFLYDGVRQLCIRYNPKVSTYKRDIPESKTDTLGSKYPFFTRNGNVNYKEFALSGLISYQVDPDNLYMNTTGLGYDDSFKSNLVSININAERQFKNDVLDWLNDGLPKLLRTPTEGNYLVRLMNVALQPMDQLGRMLHSFSCNAYEIAEVSNEILQYYGIINSAEELSLQTRWASIELSNFEVKNPIDTYQTLLNRKVTSISIVDMKPGSKIRITYASTGTKEVIMIGSTGSFKFDGTEISKIEAIIDEENMPGIITYSYNTKQVGSFGEIEDVKNYDVICRQFFGKNYQYSRYTWTTHVVTQEDLNADSLSDNVTVNTANMAAIQGKTVGTMVAWRQVEFIENLLDDISDEKITVSHLYYLRARRRELITIFARADTLLYTTSAWNNEIAPLYWDKNCTEPIEPNNLEAWQVYQIREVQRGIDEFGNVVEFSDENNFNTKKNSGYYVDAEIERFAPLTMFVLDGGTNLRDGTTSNDLQHAIHSRNIDLDEFFSVKINDEVVYVTDLQDYYLTDCSTVKSIIPEPGVIVELGYAAQEKIFKQEVSSKSVAGYKQAWEWTRDRWLNYRGYQKNLSPNYLISFPSYSYNTSTKKVTQGSNYTRDGILGIIYARYRSFYSALTSSLAQYKIKGGEID